MTVVNMLRILSRRATQELSRGVFGQERGPEQYLLAGSLAPIRRRILSRREVLRPRREKAGDLRLGFASSGKSCWGGSSLFLGSALGGRGGCVCNTVVDG